MVKSQLENDHISTCLQGIIPNDALSAVAVKNVRLHGWHPALGDVFARVKEFEDVLPNSGVVFLVDLPVEKAGEGVD